MRGRLSAAAAIGLALAVFPLGANAADPVKVIYSFKGGKDGAVPVAPLLDVGGTLYGTTSQGGGNGCGGNGCGTIFSIGPSGGEQVIHRFAGSPDDGATPTGGLVSVGGTLYGMTLDGGPNKCGSVHCGTIFSVGTNGKVTILYNFKGGKDGEFPSSDLLRIGPLLYGTTYSGGGHTGCRTGYTCGTFFSFSTSGQKTILHNFSGIGSDGGNPSGALHNISDRIYGTTEFGGRANCNKTSNSAEGCGTVYSMSTGGGVDIIYEFKGGFDGRLPTEGVVDVSGELFGTTDEGGAGSICQGGCGILYSLSTGGNETVLHTFAKKVESGLFPSGLVFFGNNLYGVTRGGGGQGGCTNVEGCGLVYSASTGGKISILHDFGSAKSDPQLADSHLIELSHKLYGVSNHGGDGKCPSVDGSTGCGTVFQVMP